MGVVGRVWSDGRTDGRKNPGTDGHNNGTDGRKNHRTDGRTDGRKETMDGRTDGYASVNGKNHMF